MRTLLTCAVVTSLFAVVVGACKKQDDTQQPLAPTATAQYPGYPPPQPTYGPYAQPTAAPQPTYGPYAQPTAVPPQPTAAPTAAPTAGQMAVPGPVAFQCTNDVPCGTHHCNTQYGKCAFPCQTAADCIAPNSCVMGLCVPAPPQQH